MMSTAVDDQVTPILVLGDGRRRALTARISKAVKTWLTGWCAPGADLEVIVDVSQTIAEAPIVSARETNCVARGSAGGVECLALTECGMLAALLKLPRRPAASIFTAESKIGISVYEEMLRSLMDVVVADLRLGSWLVEIERPRSISEGARDRYKHWWTINIGWSSQQHLVELSLAPSLIGQLAPIDVKKNGASAVEKRRAAIGSEKLRLEAVLGEATVSVGELASLAINDVIVLRDELSHASYLITSTGRKVANISLGRIGSSRAAMIAR